MDIILTIVFAAKAVMTTIEGSQSGGELFPIFQYIIPLFLFMIFAAALVSSRIKVPYTMVLVAFGIAISFISFGGLLNIENTGKFRIDPRLIINLIIPPLIFEAMMKVNYK